MNEELVTRFTGDYAATRERLAGALRGATDPGEDASAILHKLIFLMFLESAGLLDTEALTFEAPDDSEGRRYARYLFPLVERVRCEYDAFAEPLPSVAMSDAALVDAFAFLERYRFRLREEEGAITPELLGTIQERFIDPREHGSYYTRSDIARTTAEWVIREALARKWGFETPGYLLEKEVEALDAKRALRLWTDLSDFAVIDPSCGSGAFLVAAFDVLMDLHVSVYARLQHFGLARASGDPRRTLLHFARATRRNLYGVELSAGAAEVARMRLFLKMLSYGPEKPEPWDGFREPAGRIVTGNALVGLLAEGTTAVQFDLFSEFREDEWLDRRLLSEFRAAGAQVETPVFDAEGRQRRTRRRNVQLADIQDLQPVHWRPAFPEVFVPARGGFDVVLGNPPWDSFRANTKEWAARRNPAVTVRMSAEEFAPIWREMLQDPATRAEWAKFAGGFSHVVKWWSATEHLGTGDSGQKMVSVNLYPLFCRQVHNILRPGGLAAYLVPSGVLTDAACSRFREILFADGDLRWAFAAYNFGAFEGVADRFRFAVLCFGKGRPTDRFQLTVDWEKGAVDSLSCWLDAGKTVWAPAEIRAIYPDTLSIPLVTGGEDAAVLAAVARHRPAGFVADRTGHGRKLARTPTHHTRHEKESLCL